MPSSIIPLVTPADRALTQELLTLYLAYLEEESKISVEKLRNLMGVRLAKHRIGGDAPFPDTPAPPTSPLVGLDPYHWRRCE